MIWFETHVRVPAGIQHERSLARCRMDVIVVLEFGKGEQIIPIVLSLVHEEAQILLKLLVNPLRLSVCLGMIGRGGCEFNPEEPV